MIQRLTTFLIYGCVIACFPSALMGQMVAVDDTPFTLEETAVDLNVTANDINIGGGLLTVTLVSTTVNGFLELFDDDIIIYTPFLNYFGTDTFSYEVCNGEEPVAACDIGFVIISVFPVPDFPVAVDDNYSLPAQTTDTFSILANDINVDAEFLTAALISLPANGTANIIGGDMLEYTPANTFSGMDTLRYAACKSGSTFYCDSATVIINVTSDNFNAPVAVNDNVAATIYQTITIEPLLNDMDADGDALYLQSYNATGIIGTITQIENTLQYFAAEKTIDTVYYVVCDNNAPSLCDTGLIRINILNLKVDDSFSPNGDGINDAIILHGLENYPGFVFTVYNRWGDPVFETTDPFEHWDGNANTLTDYEPAGQLPEGTYYYVLQPGEGFEVLRGYIVLKR